MFTSTQARIPFLQQSQSTFHQNRQCQDTVSLKDRTPYEHFTDLRNKKTVISLSMCTDSDAIIFPSHPGEKGLH